jgi:alpha-ribazole phosphatase/probable phosphoglycerate mutase
MKPTTVWLVRHASLEGHDGRCYGWYDIRLSAEGIAQAESIAARLSTEPISRIYSSSLSRAVETARAVASPHRIAVDVVEDLGEIHFGDCEGLTYQEVEKRYPEVFESWMSRPTETQFPNGESFSQLRSRVLAALESLLRDHRSESIVVVTHAGVIRLLLAQALGIPDRHIFRLAQGYGAINRIDYFDSGPIVGLINGIAP